MLTQYIKIKINVEEGIAIFTIVLGLALLFLGVLLLVYSSKKAIEHSVNIALALKISPLLIGLLFVSVGTDLPEIVNSIVACSVGHGDINIGDSLGSVFTQMTLVLGLVAFLGGVFKVKRNEVLLLGACTIVALMLAVSISEKGYFTRENAVFLVSTWLILVLIIRYARRKDASKGAPLTDRRDSVKPMYHHVAIAIAGFTGVAVGAYAIVQSVIIVSQAFSIPEYLISFFIVAIGTSLPELVVELQALRKRQYGLAIGDAIGSCLVDASLSIGIGNLFFPQSGMNARLAQVTGYYAILSSFIVVIILALREKLDKKVGAIFIALYLLSYVTITFI